MIGKRKPFDPARIGRRRAEGLEVITPAEDQQQEEVSMKKCPLGINRVRW